MYEKMTFYSDTVKIHKNVCSERFLSEMLCVGAHCLRDDGFMPTETKCRV